MLVKFHARGRGGGSGPVDYLLGKDRQRDGASVLQGKPEEVRELIDASPYAKKYTSGVLSFAEADLPAGTREKLMASFERVLMPGLDKDQYSVLWVEHSDKGRLELNFVIPNTELLSGKRLQPYYDRADRPRIDAWQTVVNARLGLRDPNAPEHRRTLVTPNSLPKAKQEAAEAITAGLEQLAVAGELKTREDVIRALEGAGFTVARVTKSSISLADPDGGHNLRLKGALYEQSFRHGEGHRAEIERAGERYRGDAEARVQRARAACERGIALKRAENQRRHSRTYGGYERGAGVASPERVPDGQAQMGQYRDNDRVTGRDVRGIFVEPERRYSDEPEGTQTAEYGYRGAARDAGEAEREDVGHDVSRGRERSVPDIPEGNAGRYRLDAGEGKCGTERGEGETGEGLNHDDRTGNAVTERLRA
ncbi:plasmid mobilization relaxase MbeA, partial [Serratia sp. IR-2025]